MWVRIPFRVQADGKSSILFGSYFTRLLVKLVSHNSPKVEFRDRAPSSLLFTREMIFVYYGKREFRMVATAEKYIKVHITFNDNENFGGESVWAVDLDNKTARINNLPFFAESFGFNDIIRYEDIDGIHEFQEVITSVTRSWGVTWDPTDKNDREKTSEEWNQIATHLRDSGTTHFESAIAGMFVVALPTDVSDEKNWRWLKALCYSSPIKLTPYKGDDPNSCG